jgi:ABC-2 type transport system ATP-binding protein
MPAMLEVQHLTKRYGARRGIEDVSFSLERGEVLGLLGPNGAGKTTTLRVISGYLPATAGVVRVDGYDLWESPYEVRRRIGYLPDNPPLYGDMTVFDYLQFMAELHEVPRAGRNERIAEVIERLDLGDVAGRLIGRLSRGYRQRVGLAQAVVHAPPVLVCDEPTVGLDPRQIAEMRALIRDFGREHAVLFSSHILSEVRVLCSRVAIMHRGRLLAQGAPNELTAELHGAPRWSVRVKGPLEAVRAALAAVPGVADVRPAPGEESHEEGVVTLMVDGRTGGARRAAETVADDLFSALAQGGWPVRELRAVETTLEEVFLELTAGERAVSTEADEDEPAAAEPAAAKGGARRGRRR